MFLLYGIKDELVQNGHGLTNQWNHISCKFIEKDNITFSSVTSIWTPVNFLSGHKIQGVMTQANQGVPSIYIYIYLLIYF